MRKLKIHYSSYSIKTSFYFFNTYALINRNRGGRCELFSGFCEANEDFDILHLDIVSSYPSEALRNVYPTGEFEILIGKELDEVIYDENEKAYLHKGKL